MTASWDEWRGPWSEAAPRIPRLGYLDLAVAKRLLISSQLTTFHQAAR